MSLNYYSFQWSPSWLSTPFVFGGAGSPWQILDVDGLEGLPDLRVQDDNRGYNDGMFSGRDFYAGRLLTFTINVFASATASAWANLNTMQQALRPQQSGTSLLQFQLSADGNLQQIYGRVRTRHAVVDPEYTYGFIRTQVTIFCPNPKYYDDAAQTLSMTPQQVAGRAYNRTYNLTYGGGSLTNIVTVVNTGWADTGPLITINGPVTNPTITNPVTGAYMTFATTLAATDSLVIDLENKTVTLNGSSARNLLLGGSTWLTAFANSNTQFAFSGTAYTIGTTAASLVYRNAYV
jgi:hypothetical protein